MTKPHKITELFAWVVTHPDGEEGVPALDGARLGNPVFAGMALPMVRHRAHRIPAPLRNQHCRWHGDAGQTLQIFANDRA